MIGATDERIAMVDEGGEHSYAELDTAANATARALLEAAGGADDLGGARVAFHVPAGFDYVHTLLGVWRAGGIALPSEL